MWIENTTTNKSIVERQNNGLIINNDATKDATRVIVQFKVIFQLHTF